MFEIKETWSEESVARFRWALYAHQTQPVLEQAFVRTTKDARGVPTKQEAVWRAVPTVLVDPENAPS